LNPELAAGIRRLKGVRRLGVRLGNWLTPEQGRRLLVRDAGDRARLAGSLDDRDVDWVPPAPRRAVALRVESIQQREEHWVIADLVGKGGHVRTVPIPIWVKSTVGDVFAESVFGRPSKIQFGVNTGLRRPI
jgi:hypothetical protein